MCHCSMLRDLHRCTAAIAFAGLHRWSASLEVLSDEACVLRECVQFLHCSTQSSRVFRKTHLRVRYEAWVP